jgi:hypothetical protein
MMTAPMTAQLEINSIGALGGYFGPKIFGQLRDWTGTDFAGLIFLWRQCLPLLLPR